MLEVADNYNRGARNSSTYTARRVPENEVSKVRDVES